MGRAGMTTTGKDATAAGNPASKRFPETFSECRKRLPAMGGQQLGQRAQMVSSDSNQENRF
jgi:hypothetical protein